MTLAQGAVADGGALCAGCGFCCNGTLFDRIAVTAKEQETLRGLGFAFIEHESQAVFEQGCPAENCGSCTIYDARPAICRGFRCGLLQSYEAGTISLEDARAKQDKARELIGAVAADEPAASRNGPRHKLRMRLAGQMQVADPETRRRLSRQFLNVLALDSYLERWFRAKEKPVATAQTPE